MQYCTRCLYPANHPYGLIFDDYGVFKVGEILQTVKKIVGMNYSKKYNIIYNYMGQCIMIKK